MSAEGYGVKDTDAILEDRASVQRQDSRECDESGKSSQDVEVYRRRWYILTIFSLLNFAQGGIWNTWGPISSSAKEVFGWSDGNFSLLANWGPIMYCSGAMFWSWLMTNKGLRTTSLIAITLITCGAAIRCIPADATGATWLINIGHLLNGGAGPIVQGGCPLVSTTWFPADQRTTATAIMSAVLGLGIGLSYIIGPLVVTDIILQNNISSTTISSLDDSNSTWSPLDPNSTISAKDQMKHEIYRLLYVELGICLVFWLAVFIYFPSKPPKPPSKSAGAERLDYKSGLRALIRHRDFWLLGIPFSLSAGIYAAYGAVLNVNLSHRDVSQTTAGLLGFIASITGNVFCIILARVADILRRHMKFYLISLCVGGAVALFVFSLSYDGYIAFNSGILYTTQIAGGMLIIGGTALYYEFCCECAFPIPEGVTNCLLTWTNNFTMLVFLLIPLIPNIGTAWMNWCVTVSVLLCVPILAVVKGHYGRLDIDLPDDQKSTITNSTNSFDSTHTTDAQTEEIHPI